MISKEQERFVRNHITPEYFDPNKVVNYLNIHDRVGAEIFELAKKPQAKRNVRLVSEGCGFWTVDTETFIKRVPFYFFEPDYEKDQHGDLLSLICGKARDDQDNDFEEVYIALEKLFYQYNIGVPEIMGYPISLTGTYGRADIFFMWVHYRRKAVPAENCAALSISGSRWRTSFLPGRSWQGWSASVRRRR